MDCLKNTQAKCSEIDHNNVINSDGVSVIVHCYSLSRVKHRKKNKLTHKNILTRKLFVLFSGFTSLTKEPIFFSWKVENFCLFRNWITLFVRIHRIALVRTKSFAWFKKVGILSLQKFFGFRKCTIKLKPSGLLGQWDYWDITREVLTENLSFSFHGNSQIINRYILKFCGI